MTVHIDKLVKKSRLQVAYAIIVEKIYNTTYSFVNI